MQQEELTAYAEETAQSTKPLTTLWKTQEVGTHEGTGTYAYDAAAKTVTVNGAGTKFDKSAGSDDYSMLILRVKEI